MNEMKLKLFQSIIIFLTVLSGSASASSVLPYLSRLKTAGPLSCTIPGFSSYSYTSSRYEEIVICLVDNDLIFTLDGARYTEIEALRSEQGRYMFAFGRQIDCRELREKGTGGWRLFSFKPHQNWFKPKREFGVPMKVADWWYIPFYGSFYSDWEVIDPPLSPLQKQICKAWLRKRNSIFD